MDYEQAAPILEAVATAEGAIVPLDFEALASELAVSPVVVRDRIEDLERLGLMSLAGGESPPLLLDAGRQYIAAEGDVDDDVLALLPHVIDDLHARRALLLCGGVLVDEFRGALLNGGGVEHARQLVPPAFAAAVDDALALDLFAAAVALLARLSAGEPAGCVAEEVIAVSLIEAARSWLELEADSGALAADDARRATDELTGLFELFEDDDVLQLFDMREPGDAAVRGHSELSHHLGVVDQRLEAWFAAFDGTASTGYLHDPPAG